MNGAYKFVISFDIGNNGLRVFHSPVKEKTNSPCHFNSSRIVILFDIEYGDLKIFHSVKNNKLTQSFQPIRNNMSSIRYLTVAD